MTSGSLQNNLQILGLWVKGKWEVVGHCLSWEIFALVSVIVKILEKEKTMQKVLNWAHLRTNSAQVALNGLNWVLLSSMMLNWSQISTDLNRF